MLPQSMDGLYTENLKKTGWSGGTPILGNHHMFIVRSWLTIQVFELTNKPQIHDTSGGRNKESA